MRTKSLSYRMLVEEVKQTGRGEESLVSEKAARTLTLKSLEAGNLIDSKFASTQIYQLVVYLHSPLPVFRGM